MATDTHSSAGDGVAAASAPGMPQLDFSTFGNQIFWLVLALIAIYLVLSRMALPRIGAVLAERQGTITNDIAKAEDLNKRAKEAEAAYEQALADARTEAQRIIAETKVGIKQDLDAAIAKADAEIAAKSADAEKAIAEIRAGAMDAVRDVATDTVGEIVTAMGGKADPADLAAAVQARMKG
ncbi:MAG: F0F1 ATP synthase subunit B' [Rhodobacteraceae bacterium]|nr:F0F1 ATP synthase subunit B' [Paracoccaceae bacterium]